MKISIISVFWKLDSFDVFVDKLLSDLLSRFLTGSDEIDEKKFLCQDNQALSKFLIKTLSK